MIDLVQCEPFHRTSAPGVHHGSSSTSVRGEGLIRRFRPIRYSSILFAAAAVCLVLSTGVLGDDLPAPLEPLDAREAVHHGNQLLIQGDAPRALEAYERAKALRPDAFEIPFVQGLGHYALQEYEEARQSFEKAAVSKNRKLAGDATYSVGTTYHAEALEGADDPQLAIEKLESAMQRYQNVLANQPEHVEARDAIVKAASMRRQLKRMLEQQEQQQQKQDQDQQNNEEDSDDQQQQEGQEQDEQDEKQQSESQQEQSDEQTQNDKQSAEQEKESEASQDEEDEEQQEQDSRAEQEEQTSREQAQRRLREMMQDMHERKKRHRQKLQPFRVVPVDKDR